jgi:Carbohydrate family 9 binding domain-like
MNALWLVMMALLAEGVYRVEPTTASARSLLEASDDEWREAVRLDYGPNGYRTQFRALWSEDALFLRFDVSDPEPWHTMTRRDDPLWDEEVVEIFLDLDGSGTNYAEVELSPANVVCDVRMVRGSPDKKMDLSFDLEGLESRVVPREGGWTGLLRLPWSGFRPLPSAAHISLPPKPGDRWRFNVYRIERPNGKGHPSDGAIFASWSPTGSDSFHVPASFQTFELASGRR